MCRNHLEHIITPHKRAGRPHRREYSKENRLLAYVWGGAECHIARTLTLCSSVGSMGRYRRCALPERGVDRSCQNVLECTRHPMRPEGAGKPIPGSGRIAFPVLRDGPVRLPLKKRQRHDEQHAGRRQDEDDSYQFTNRIHVLPDTLRAGKTCPFVRIPGNIANAASYEGMEGERARTWEQTTGGTKNDREGEMERRATGGRLSHRKGEEDSGGHIHVLC
jgi:hypothetical protein